MQIKVINDNPYGQNIYIYYDENTRDGVIIDPGDSFETVKKTLSEEKINIKAILLTHGHFDHTFRVEEVRELTGAPLYAHANEVELLKNADFNRSGYRGLFISVTVDETFADGDVFTVGAAKLQVIHTPGHTAGGVCYYDADAKIIFTGDTLFKETIGRTDMPTGDHATLVSSVRERLFSLPDDVRVYPGHEESTTISHEKKHNQRA